MSLGPTGWLSLILALVQWSEARLPSAEPRPEPPRPPEPPPSPPEPGPGPVPTPVPELACYRIEFMGRVYQWTRAELDAKVKGTAFDDPDLRAKLDALDVGESIRRAGAKLTRIECDVLDIEPGPAPPIPAPPPAPSPGEAPLWPLPGRPLGTKVRASRRFGALRKAGTKHHAGIDLGAPEGTVVVAPEDGRLVATQGWDGPNAKAVLLETARPDGPVLFFGAVAPDSWPTDAQGNLVERDVKRGEQIAVLGRYPGPKRSSMLHFEMYRRGSRNNRKWFVGSRPNSLLDPTSYVESMVAT